VLWRTYRALKADCLPKQSERYTRLFAHIIMFSIPDMAFTGPSSCTGMISAVAGSPCAFCAIDRKMRIRHLLMRPKNVQLTKE